MEAGVVAVGACIGAHVIASWGAAEERRDDEERRAETRLEAVHADIAEEIAAIREGVERLRLSLHPPPPMPACRLDDVTCPMGEWP